MTGDLVRVSLPAPTAGGREHFELGAVALDGLRVDAGCPHVVVSVVGLDEAPISEWGPKVRFDPRFAPGGTNVDLAEWRADGDLGVRTWERGVENETLSCGTGALAAAAAARLAGRGDVVRIRPRSGVPLSVRFDGSGRVALEGDARIVFRGEVSPEGTSGFDGS